MGIKKVLSYGRFVLVMLLALYLILVWMYFKDNARHLTSSGLLLWFVAIPLLLISTIAALLWWQKKADKHTLNASDDMSGVSGAQEPVQAPNTYQLFIYSRVCLPEGNSWSEIIDNDKDVTVLSEDLVDIDGLPILIKPINNLPDAASLPYGYVIDADTTSSGFDDGFSSSITLRLCSLIQAQLALGDDLLSTLAVHFNQYHKQDEVQSNSAIHVHPEWQQHYLISANEENNDDIISTSSEASLSKLPIYLCLPTSADSTFLITAVKEQLMSYAFPEAVLSIIPIVTDDTDVESNAVTYDPAQFINKHIKPLSQSSAPEICFVLIADSQIHEEWLDTHLFANPSVNIVPTEAGVLLVFFNKAAQKILDIDPSASVLLTEVCTPSHKNSASKNNGHDHSATHDSDINTGTRIHSDLHERTDNRRHYLKNLTTIKHLLMDNNLSLSPNQVEEQKIVIQDSKKVSKTNVVLSDITITAMSDINPVTQSYDISKYMSFIEAFTIEGALVNDYHLGHYMPLNNWLKPFISLSLFIEFVKLDHQELEALFLITQHKHSNMLWLADFSQTSDYGSK
ncbi:hypothetical protein ACT3TH_08480 [Psychrobacter sp. AOP22-C1-C5]|uniref:hypothetical protein n=1 Tax=Psychrobacter sp. AOP22-C1-C5 TaxID=3457716 RepID=UPI0040367C1A